MFVPIELQAFPHFVVWRAEPRPPAKPAKVPYCPLDGRCASVSQSTDWTSLNQALAVVADFDGLGFVFAKSDPFAGVDLDGCRDPISGTIAPWALDIIQQLDTYTEVSPSGSGVKLFLRGALPGRGRRFGRIELYDNERYFTLTGQHVPGTPTTVNDRGAELLRLLERLDDRPTLPVSTTPTGWRFAPVDVVSTGGGGPADQALVLQKALDAANGDKFARLWRGDKSEYDDDWSRADLALCRLLARHAGRYAVLIDTLFRRSGLMRPKWDEQRGDVTYGQRTIQKALEPLRRW